MGKNKQKKKNVFKVSDKRSKRAKSKAKKVKTVLKKLDLGQGSKLNKDKTNLINKQLVELSKEVHRPENKKKATNSKGKTAFKLKEPVSIQTKEQTTSLIENMQI